MTSARLDQIAHQAAADEIRSARDLGNLSAAIERCKAAIQAMPDDPFFSRVFADLLFEQKKYEEAFIALADYLSVTPISQKKQFALRYARFRRVFSKEKMAHYAKLLSAAISEANIEKNLAFWAKNLIRPDLSIDQPLKQTDIPQLADFLSKLNDDANFFAVAKQEKEIEEKYHDGLLRLLDGHILNRQRALATFRIDLFCASIYERFQRHNEALKVLSEILHIRLDPVAARTLFRICRLVGNYDHVDELLAREPSLAKTNEFNVLYELVYYYESRGEFRQLQNVLRKIEQSFGQNLPVLRTLKNFFIRFGLLEDAQRLEPKILAFYSKSGKSSKFLDTLAESDAEVTSKMQQLYSELEHQKQLAAISDLTTGISHELGQPITNIRYTIQFYRRLLEKKLTKEGVFAVFDSILEETKRMGGLIGRLSPLTSSKAVLETFDVMERISSRIRTEQARLQEGKISVRATPPTAVFLHGDPVKFDQLVSNLLLNSIDAILERKTPGKNEIRINVSQDEKEISIGFSDTGIGIPPRNRNTIFDPFFSTKPPGKGEGLGLFIVWNLLKMQGGTISVDPDYENGAKMNIRIPANSENIEKVH
jgi:signal transduction histidine kinase